MYCFYTVQTVLQMCLRITKLSFIGGDKEGLLEHSVGDHRVMDAAIWSGSMKRIFSKVFAALLPVLPLCQALPVQQHSAGLVGGGSWGAVGLCLIH